MPGWEMDGGSRERFEARLAAVATPLRRWMLKMYANPVISRYAGQDVDPFQETETGHRPG